MADLSEKVAEEQQQFIRAQWQDAQDVERFRCMDPRIEAQLQVRHSMPSSRLQQRACQLGNLSSKTSKGMLKMGPVIL